VPVGCAHDPADRGGLAGFVCEMALRGAGPRDSRMFITDLDNLGVERSESVSDAHTSFSGATLAENLPSALAIYADLLRRALLPPAQVEAVRQMMLQELRAVEDEPSQKVMIELCRRKNVKLGCAFMMRFVAQHREALKLVEEGRLGKPTYARAQLSCWYPLSKVLGARTRLPAEAVL